MQNIALTAPPEKPQDTPHETPGDGHSARKPAMAALTLGVLGVVYGDIGTSPLYALREAMVASGATRGHAPAENIFGVISLIIWTLTLIVSVKYVGILLRADNDGEGGTLSLLALAQRALGQMRGRRALVLVVLGILGAALFSGDAVITPAVSVLSAVEGLKLIAPGTAPFVEPVAMAVIVLLFWVQKHGTDFVSRFFGPVMLLWFLVLAAGGLWRLCEAPEVLSALSPHHALQFLLTHQGVALAVLGSVFLAVTGAEALYADMGHFGARPIRIGWFYLTFPALVLNYLGQGAELLTRPEALESPFYLMFPPQLLVPMVVLAMLATVIASQAVITGAFSLAQQAIQLRLLPRLKIRQTSEEQQGQIYLPLINGLLMFGVLALVLTFGSSSALAAAYGISVSGAMLVTSLLAVVVVRWHWRWPVIAILAVMGPLVALEMVFLGSNLMKVADGGYVPLALAGALLVVMLIWRRGTAIVQAKDAEGQLPLAALVTKLGSDRIAKVPGTAVFLTASPENAPVALLHSLKHFRALHEQNIILSIVTRDLPRLSDETRLKYEEIAPGFRRIILQYGYAEDPDVPRALMLARQKGLKFDIMSTSFILSRRSLRPSVRPRMPMWQARLFIWMSRNAASAQDYFRIPAGRVVEIGTQVSL
ncbi:potassium transporter Kup [Pseudomonas sp. GX19020]|uniref:potassium transporter Kup n=1 Tax=Pseudomonas sp. GX19020 TaxID=2942277 RepID=UPI00201927CF|nr:potassium transporter Kup [Pseudomonas sp. GX19020]MCL4067071.1 potassium transporter Kup [Pseudomonas sp. GX19020]